MNRVGEVGDSSADVSSRLALVHKEARNCGWYGVYIVSSGTTLLVERRINYLE